MPLSTLGAKSFFHMKRCSPAAEIYRVHASASKLSSDGFNMAKGCIATGQSNGRCSMKISVKLYASFREIVGAKEQEIEVAEGTTVQMLLEEYIKRFPKIDRFREHVILSVNKEYGHPNRKLKDGDEISFLPPVSGG